MTSELFQVRFGDFAGTRINYNVANLYTPVSESLITGGHDTANKKFCFAMGKIKTEI
jgi:hypothetical protein